MSPTKTNASESISRPRRVSTPTRKQRKRYKQKKIPKSLNGVPLCIYGAKMDDVMNGDAIIQPLVVSESAHSSSNVTSPQDTENMASSYFPPTNFVQSKNPASTQVYRGAEPSHMSFQYDLDFNGHPEDFSPLTNNPSQSYGRYDPSCHFIPPSSSTNEAGSLSTNHGVEPYWFDPNAQYYSIPSYVSNASSTFPGNSDNDIYAIPGSSNFTMTSANDETTFPFPNYEANNLHSCYM